MQNCQFDEMDGALRREKLKRIILAKAKGISNGQVEQILGVIDIRIQYTITGTANFNALLRNAVAEDGGELFQVHVIPVYGSLRPGFVDRSGRMTKSTLARNEPAAIIKETSITDGETVHLQHSIFIYQKRTAPAALIPNSPDAPIQKAQGAQVQNATVASLSISRTAPLPNAPIKPFPMERRYQNA